MKKNLKNSAQFSIYNLYVNNRQVIILHGILSMIFGVIALLSPYLTVMSMILIYGAYLIIDGMLYIMTAINREDHKRHWSELMIIGVFNIIIGFIILIAPQFASVGVIAFVWLMISSWMIITGAAKIMTSYRLFQENHADWAVLLSGIFSIILSIIILALTLFNPVISIVLMSWLLGIDALSFGAMLLFSIYQIHRLRTKNPSV